ncbi:MAG: DUF6443 domain-containing protein, partial [Bacteroidota bacterium]
TALRKLLLCLSLFSLSLWSLQAQVLPSSSLAPPVDIMQEASGNFKYQTKLLPNGDLIVYGEATTSTRTHTITKHHLSNGTDWIEFDEVVENGQTTLTCRMRDVANHTTPYANGIAYVDPASIDLNNYSINNTTVDTKTDTDMLISRIDRTGQTIWTQTFGSAAFENWGITANGSRATLTSDGHIVFGYNQSSHDFEHHRLALTKISLADGSIAWSKVGQVNPYMSQDFISDLVELSDGSLIATGHSINTASANGYSLKFDANGNYQYAKILNGGGNAFMGGSLLLNPQNDVLFNGRAYSAGAYRTKLSLFNTSNDDVIWTRDLAFNDPAKSAYRITTAAILNHPQGGYLGFGNSEGGAEQHALVYRVDANGNMLWSQEYDFSTDVLDSRFTAGAFLPNGNIQLAGTFGQQTVLTQLSANDGSLLWAKSFGSIYRNIPSFLSIRASGEIVLTNLIVSYNPGLRLYAFNLAGEAHDRYSCEVSDISTQIQAFPYPLNTSVAPIASVDIAYNFTNTVLTTNSTPKAVAPLPACASIGYSCDQEPIIWAQPTNSENYIHNQTFREAVQNDNDIAALTDMRQKQESITYFDGLGRGLQSTAVGLSPSRNDVIQPVVLDQFGQQPIQYLPYTDGGNLGSYRSNPISDQSSFYQTLYPNEPAFAETLFEASPLGRVEEQGAAGTPWQLAQGHTQEADYLHYGDPLIPVSLVVPYFEAGVEIWDQADFNGYKKATTTDPSSDLYVSVSIDENEHPSYTFVDKMGKTIMQSVQIETGVFANTLYLYDEFDRVKFVLQPQGFEDMLGFNGTLHMDVMQSYAFWYEYDSRGRVVMKKVPGAEAVHMVYDRQDRAILVADGNNIQNDIWLFSKFDILGRPIMTGEWHFTASASDPYGKRIALQQLVDNSALPLFETPVATNPSVQHGYTDQAFPSHTSVNSGLRVLSVSYYDDYDFD